MSGSAQRYAVLVNGDPPDFITERYGNYGDIYVQLLRDPAREEVWDVFRAFEGSFPEEAGIASYDTLIFTGSKYDAYKDEDWIVRCREIIIQAHARKQKILGICFGAQLLATALSGRVAPSNQGMQMGAVKCTLVADDVMLRYLLDASSSFVINQIHRDEIQALPAGARLLASSKYCPVEAFAIENHILATQGHPEFTKEYMEFYLQGIAARGMFPAEACRQWMRSLEEFQLDAPAWRLACQRFVKGSV